MCLRIQNSAGMLCRKLGLIKLLKKYSTYFGKKNYRVKSYFSEKDLMFPYCNETTESATL